MTMQKRDSAAMTIQYQRRMGNASSQENCWPVCRHGKMRATIASLACGVWFVLLCSVISVQATPVDLDGSIYLSQPFYPCDGVQREAWWTNTLGKTIYITGGYVWQGVARDLKGDVGFQLYVWKKPGQAYSILRVGMWDHYSEPSGAEDNISPIRLDGHYYAIEPYGALKLAYGCALVGAQNPAMESYYRTIGGHHQQAFLYYSETKP